jgi:hypothetical protein
MATALQQLKLKQLFDKTMPSGGPKAFRAAFEESVGLRYRETQAINEEGDISGTRHEQYYDAETDLFRDNHRADREKDGTGHWHIGEVFSAICGPQWKKKFEQCWKSAAQSRFEAFGGTMMPGDTPYVSAALDVVAGLLNARALARAKDPEWIWDKVTNVQEATGEGGFHIGSRLDPSNFDGSGTDLARGQSLPTTKLLSTRVHRNRTHDQGRRAEVDYWTMRDDLTGQVMESIDQVSLIVLAERERKVADGTMGVASGTTFPGGANIGIPGQLLPQVQDGMAWFPWQKGTYVTNGSAGGNAGSTTAAPENQAYIANYANCGDGDGLGLTNYIFVPTALQILSSNLDPFTQLPTQVSMQGMQFIVAPAVAVQLKVLLEQEAIWQIAWGTATPGSFSNVTQSRANVVKELGLDIIPSMFWANRAINVGLATQSAAGSIGSVTGQTKLTNNAGDSFNTAGSIMSAYWMGHFKDATIYWQRDPYHTEGVPLGSVEMGARIVLIQDHREMGQLFWHNPRVCWRSWS